MAMAWQLALEPSLEETRSQAKLTQPSISNLSVRCGVLIHKMENGMDWHPILCSPEPKIMKMSEYCKRGNDPTSTIDTAVLGVSEDTSRGINTPTPLPNVRINILKESNMHIRLTPTNSSLILFFGSCSLIKVVLAVGTMLLLFVAVLGSGWCHICRRLHPVEAAWARSRSGKSMLS